MTDRCYKHFDSTYKPSTPRPPPQNRPPSPQALFVQSNTAPPETWYLDSGTSTHVTPHLNTFTSYMSYFGANQLRVGDEKGLAIFYTGSSFLVTNHHPIVLNIILNVPLIFKPLIRIS
jgi:hypothetical protein